jgi:uncharacterized protein YigA (DUF484 family)
MKSQPAAAALTPEEVLDWLRANPDFFHRYPQALFDLQAPAASHGENVADFQHFMAERLREDRNLLEEQLGELVELSRGNLHSQGRIHAAVIALMDARNFESLISCVTTDLPLLLDVDVARLVIESNGLDPAQTHASGVRVVDEGKVESWLSGRQTRLEADIIGNPEIFGEAAPLVKSQALLRLDISSETPPGILAFGSRDAGLFDPHQGTELIGFLARVIERLLRAELEMPA